MILGSSHQDAITILNNRASKLIFMKQNLTELHKESHIFTTIVGNSSTLSIINTVLLAIVTGLCFTPPGLIYLIKLEVCTF